MKKKIVIAIVGIAALTSAFMGGRAYATVNAATNNDVEQISAVEETKEEVVEETPVVEEKVEETVVETVEETPVVTTRPATTQQTTKRATTQAAPKKEVKSTEKVIVENDVLEIEGSQESVQIEVSNEALTPEQIEAIMNTRN